MMNFDKWKAELTPEKAAFLIVQSSMMYCRDYCSLKDNCKCADMETLCKTHIEEWFVQEAE